jgi:Flp pilus assembly protein TadD
MKPHSTLLVAAALAVTACSPKRLSPVVLHEPAPAKSVPAKPVAARAAASPVVRPAAAVTAPAARTAAAPAARPAAPATAPTAQGAANHQAKAPVRSSAGSARAKADEAARTAEKKRRLAAARRVQARKLAEASYDAGRQLLRENQTEPALRAFRESVRLNSHSPDAWMGVAYICEITGNTKDALEAFRAAKKLWGM